MEKFNLTYVKNKKSKTDISDFDYESAKTVNNFHKSFDIYEKTPLVDLKNLAKEIGLKSFFVKDESYRFGLNAFKVLGASYAIANFIREKIGLDENKFTFDEITSAETRKKLGHIIFSTATDGNHGRAVAWTANKLGQKSKVFMPKGSSPERLENIIRENSDANIMEVNYDDCVRLAAKFAEENKGVLIQDTSWEGYTDVPKNIMKGYMTMAYEAHNDFREKGIFPSHIFLQAGVGSMAASVTAFFRNVMKDNPPKIIIVEPNKANCLYRTADANDGKLHFVKGDLDSMMAGLNCGEPVTIGWPILESYADYFLSVDDIFTKIGMRVLANNISDDKKIISGESGAVTSGIVYSLMTDDSLRNYREKIGLDKDSVVLCISTEGDTDKKSYKEIICEEK